MTDAQVNGPSDEGKYIDQIDPEDPEYIRQMRRPAEVKEDVKQMDERKRVSMIMKTQAFREELEEIVADQFRSGPHPASLLALQQITELLMPHAKGGSSGGRLSAGGGPAIPISDIRGVDSLNYTKGEKILRCKVASFYRLIDMFNWSHNFGTLITTRISQDHEHFLVMPHGLMLNEVTASSLLKVDMRGETLDPGSTTLSLNRAAYSLHAAIHAARPDIKCVVHVQNPSTTAVSVLNCGLLPLCPEAVNIGEVSYYEYPGVLADQEEKDKVGKALGPINKVLFLRCYGVVIGGDSVEEAFDLLRNVVTACDLQLQTLPAGEANIIPMSDESRKRAAELYHAQAGAAGDGESKKKWRHGDMVFEALMRNLDSAGYRTGYLYREPVTRRTDGRHRANSEVEIPPSATSAQYFEADGRSPLKHHMDRQKKAFKTEWLNTPNSYKKEEIPEIGTPHPKTITKWVSDGGQQGEWVSGDEENKTSTPVKVEHPNQFAPIGQDPKELKHKYKEIRKEYYEDKITAGPQSRILEGITWDEAQRIKDGHVSGTSDSMIMVGAASKGIIQRDHQHNAVVYKTYYAPNPFDNMNEEDIEKYKSDVEQKQHGGESSAGGEGDTDLEPGPDGRLISTAERMEYVRQTVTETAPPKGHHQEQQQQQQHQGHEQSAQYLETSVDDVTDSGKFVSDTVQVQQQEVNAQRGVMETNIDDPPVQVTYVKPQHAPQAQKVAAHKPATKQEFGRSQSARYAPQKSRELVEELKRLSSKDDTAVNGDDGVTRSPTKSTTSSGEGTLDERSSRDVSPAKDVVHESPEKSEKKKKKFRIPSFSKKKDKKK